MNTVKTVLLMGLLTGLFILVGDLIGGRSGMYIALGLAAVMNLASYWFSDKIVLAMYRAQPVDEASAPGLFRIVHRLTSHANLPMPAVYIIPDPSPNAFATGRDPQHAAVAVTEGILRLLSEDELEGVLAHELSHVGNRDILISAIAATLAGALMILVRIFAYSAMLFGGGRGDDDEGGNPLVALLMMIFAPIAAMLIQMAISRSREYQADASAAQLTGNPLGLARALAKLQRGVEYAPMDAQPATAHLFIVNPLSARGIMNLFSTHPPIEDRIARLEAMARG
jgi:heat shock protein HtpX